MRTFRLVAGVLVALVGALALVVGGVGAFWYVGPDDVIAANPRRVSTKGVAIVAPPDVITHYGTTLHLTVSPQEPDREIFIGTGHEIDVNSYLGDAVRAEVSALDFPSGFQLVEIVGEETRVPPPTRLDWWEAKVSGKGTQELVWELSDRPTYLAVMAADGKGGLNVTTTIALEFTGAFRTALIVFGAGAVLLVLGILLMRIGRSKKTRIDEDDTVLWEGKDLWDRNEFWSDAPR